MLNAFNGFNIMSPMSSQDFQKIGYNSGPGGAIANAIKGTIDKYHQTIAAQQEQQNKMDLITFEDKVKRPWLYPQDGTQGTPNITAEKLKPRVVSERDPATGKALISTAKFDPEKGYDEYSSFSPVSPVSAEQEVKDKMWSKFLLNGAGGNVIQQGAGAQPQPAQIPIVPVVGGKPIDANTARAIMQQAGGDPNKARAIAKSQGYQF